MSATSEELETLRHMLGLPETRDSNVIPSPYRNYYAANRGDEQLAEMARKGLVYLAGSSDALYGGDLYYATDMGKTAARASVKVRKVTRSERRYLRWLTLHDAVPDLSFGEFLRNEKRFEVGA